MTPAAVIKGAAADGVTLALTGSGAVRASGESAAVARWRGAVAQHKTAIVDLLIAANDAGANPDARHRHWHLTLSDRGPLEVIFSDDLTRAEVQTLYPTAAALLPEAEA